MNDTADIKPKFRVGDEIFVSRNGGEVKAKIMEFLDGGYARLEMTVKETFAAKLDMKRLAK